jgi:hypothetical protein
MPLTDSVCPLPSILIPSLPRSGKFGTPWLRMQFENARVELVELEPLPVEALAPPVDELVGLGEVDPFGELELQAAITIAAATAVAVPSSRAVRTARRRCSCIESPSGLPARVRFLLADGDDTARKGTVR